MDLKIVYEDQDVVVVDKPVGIPCHPLKTSKQLTVLDQVIERYPEVGQVGKNTLEKGLCHRLDNDTRGLLLFAKTQKAFECYHQAFLEQRIEKAYEALVVGDLSEPLCIKTPIAHHPKNKTKMICVPHLGISHRGKPKSALTWVTPLTRGMDQGIAWTFIYIQIKGGHRHQIRVHLSGMGYPLVGDRLYGGRALLGYTHHVLFATELKLLNGRELCLSFLDVFKKNP